MTPEERAIVAQATADEWKRLAGMSKLASVRSVCFTKARVAERKAQELRRRA